MRGLRFLRMFLSILVLFIAVGAGWFLHTIPLFNQSVNAHSRETENASNPSGPLSSKSGNQNGLSPNLLRYHTAARENLLELTAGLRPGRGDTIPNASDITDLPVADVSFYNWRGELLSGWFSASKQGAPVIILGHGTPGNRVSMVGRAAFLHQHGYNVLLFDFQSYGKSQGEISTLGMVESEDILAAINYLHGLPQTMYSKIGVLGLSMGATAGVLASARSNDIVALVAESCPQDATRVEADVPDESSRQADKDLVDAIYGVDITQARPVDFVSKLGKGTAIFFINGNDDTITPLDGMQSMYQTARNPKEQWIVQGAGHAESFSVDPDGYKSHVNNFFDKYLQ